MRLQHVLSDQLSSAKVGLGWVTTSCLGSTVHICRGMYLKMCCGPLQEKKLLVFEGTVGRDAEALGRLTEDDLRFLFA